MSGKGSLFTLVVLLTIVQIQSKDYGAVKIQPVIEKVGESPQCIGTDAFGLGRLDKCETGTDKGEGQQWIITGETIKHKNTGRCLAAKKNGAAVQLEECDTGKMLQQWTYDEDNYWIKNIGKGRYLERASDRVYLRRSEQPKLDKLYFQFLYVKV